MGKRSIILTCEVCDKQFEAGARRRRVHCSDCAQDLRDRGQGPGQIKKTKHSGRSYCDTKAREICWGQVEEDLAYYLKRFRRFGGYDGITPSHPDRITEEDRHLANKIAARMSARTWASIVGESIAQVGDWDLLSMSDPQWQSSREVVREALSPLLEHTGIGVARLTKALHRKRPKLIPVCDDVVLKALRVGPGSKSDRIVGCMDRFRVIGREQLPRLQELRRLSRELEAEMTELRILEVLYWVQFGPFPRVGK